MFAFLCICSLRETFKSRWKSKSVSASVMSDCDHHALLSKEKKVNKRKTVIAIVNMFSVLMKRLISLLFRSEAYTKWGFNACKLKINL